ncbi:MAG: hypothetical protein RL660_2542 [Bacteroidota bacterium]|jgi:para-aminobenzoate synthetase component 1
MLHWVEKCNKLGKDGVPFLLLCDFMLQDVQVIPLSELDAHGVLLQFPHFSNASSTVSTVTQINLEAKPIALSTFEKAFKLVQQELSYGNTFLCNLTASTPLSSDINLRDVYDVAQSTYKILYQQQWLCYSPERFVKMQANTISTNPMKGTIDASLPNAAETILADVKETAEHYTIVDLLRNDLSMVSSYVRVKNFRYLSEIKSKGATLLQVSSEIVGELPNDWQAHIGDIMQKLLPAGSISGAPKKKTVSIIEEAEALLQHKRGFYTGVAAVFDGTSLDSCVLIRFIEKLADGSFVYKSGGGITHQSVVEQEYKELIQKIYVPSA